VVLAPEMKKKFVPTENMLPDTSAQSSKEEGASPADLEVSRALGLYLRDTLGSVFRNMNGFQPGRRKPVKRSDVEMYTRMYKEKRNLFLDS